jgi:AraC-like DNA-binding protein
MGRQCVCDDGAMQGVPSTFDHSHDRADFKSVAHEPGVELFRAHIVRHAFEPHTHQAFGLGVIEAGVERFRYRGSDHLAPPHSVVLMNPNELHTGRAETSGGWCYRMLYIDASTVERVSGESGWWFEDAVRSEPRVAQQVVVLQRQMWAAQSPLEFDGLLHTLLLSLRPLARVARPVVGAAAVRFDAVLALMREQLHQRLSLHDLARVVDLSPCHFLRCFKAQHHVTPHQMLMAMRLWEAKRRLAQGQAPASVAADVGLTDQAHLNRAFLRRYGTTPGRYQAQVWAGAAPQAGTRRRLGPAAHSMHDSGRQLSSTHTHTHP